jgi:hypothetical protein
LRLINEKILCIAVAMVIIFEEKEAQKIRFILQNSIEVEYILQNPMALSINYRDWFLGCWQDYKCSDIENKSKNKKHSTLVSV